MKKTITIVSLMVASVAGFLIFYRKPAVRNPPVENQTEQTSMNQKWETKIDDQASVNVMVTPLDLGEQSLEWKFDVGMNTHSVELDQDMTQSAVLIGDDSKEYKPTKWDGPAGSHHREGILSFAPITPYPQHLTLKVRNIGGVDRTFSWITQAII